MSDRIAVMDHGTLVQVGTPREIYYQPRTEFVGKFFGENNLLPVSLQINGGIATFDTPLGVYAASSTERDMLAAIRPESFCLHEEGSVPAHGQRTCRARLDNVTFLGATTQLSVSLPGDHRLKVRVPTVDWPATLRAGDDLALRWAEADVSFLPRG